MSRPTPNTIAHFDISGPNAGALEAFYAGLFGWAVLSKGPGYALVDTPEGSPKGAIVEAESSAFTVGIVVADLDCDPAGNTVTVIQG